MNFFVEKLKRIFNIGNQSLTQPTSVTSNPKTNDTQTTEKMPPIEATEKNSNQLHFNTG